MTAFRINEKLVGSKKGEGRNQSSRRPEKKGSVRDRRRGGRGEKKKGAVPTC